MNKEENTNHILIEVLNNNGDLKLTKFRKPQAMWQNNDYPDEYVFKDVDYVNTFQLIQENKQLKDNWNKLKEYIVNEYFMFIPLNATTKSIMILLEKMQELEKGDSNE